MEERTLRVLEFNTVKQMLQEKAVCVEARERCGALLPVENIYEARALLSLASEAESLIIKKGVPPISPVRNISSGAMRAAAGGVLSMGELLSIAHVLRMARGLKSYCDEDDFSQNYPSLAKIFAVVTENKKLEKAKVEFI